MTAMVSHAITRIASIVAFSGLMVINSSAAMASCNGPGNLCIYDFETSHWGSLPDDNRWWGAFNWNDRADGFVNYGNYCNVTVFEDIDYNGASLNIDKGTTRWYPSSGSFWHNRASSNSWCDY